MFELFTVSEIKSYINITTLKITKLYRITSTITNISKLVFTPIYKYNCKYYIRIIARLRSAQLSGLSKKSHSICNPIGCLVVAVPVRW